MWTLVLFAQAPPKRTEPFLRRPEDWVVVGLLFGAMLAAAAAFWLVERWRKRTQVREHRGSELTDYREMYERGEITEEEYVRLRDRVARRVKNRPAPPAAAPAGEPGPPDEVLRQLGWDEMEDRGEPPPHGPAAGGPQQPPPPV
jgi:hypothetical protein